MQRDRAEDRQANTQRQAGRQTVKRHRRLRRSYNSQQYDRSGLSSIQVQLRTGCNASDSLRQKTERLRQGRPCRANLGNQSTGHKCLMALICTEERSMICLLHQRFDSWSCLACSRFIALVPTPSAVVSKY